MLNILLYYHKRKLAKLIESDASYEKILKQSIILDKYINEKMRVLN